MHSSESTDLFDENENGEGQGRKRACRVYLQSEDRYRLRSGYRWTILEINDGLLLFHGDVLLLLMVNAKYDRVEMLNPNPSPPLCSEDLIAVLNSDSNAKTPTTART